MSRTIACAGAQRASRKIRCITSGLSGTRPFRPVKWGVLRERKRPRRGERRGCTRQRRRLLAGEPRGSALSIFVKKETRQNT